MLPEQISKEMKAHLARIEKEREETVLVKELPTMNYVPWEDCLSDGMLAVLFSKGVTP